MKYSHLCFTSLATFTMLACTSNPEPSATTMAPALDDTTGEMVVALRETMVLARSVPGISITGRDYAYLGPVEIDNTGARDFYLWVGLGSTVDRKFAGERSIEATEITLTLDGEEVNYPLLMWHEDVHHSPFEVSTPLQHSLRAAVTLEDLERIGRAKTVGMQLVADGGKTVTYDYWQGNWPEWSAMADDTELGFTVQVHSAGLEE